MDSVTFISRADIQIAKRLDYEKVRQYSLEVSVTDDKYVSILFIPNNWHFLKILARPDT